MAEKVGGQGGLPPAWVLAGLEAPAGEKDLGSHKIAVFTEEQQKRLNVDEAGNPKHHVVGGKGGLPPAWVQAGLEAPKGEKDMGSYKIAVFTEEQMARLSIDEAGNPKHHAVGGKGGLPPAWVQAGLEAPKGEKDMGSYKIAVFTEEQQTRLNVDEAGNPKHHVVGGKGGLPPAWVQAGLEAPKGEKDMGSYKIAVFTEEQQTRLNVDEAGNPKHHVVGGKGGLPPAWIQAGLEAPKGEKDMGSYKIAVFTEEQQKRLHVDETGKPVRALLGGKGGLPPAWIQAGLEPPAGEEDHGSFKTAVYTAEQQARLKVDSHGNPVAAAPAAAAAADHHVVGKKTGMIGPAWTRGEIEAPKGQKNMGTWVAAVYTEEQQKRLGVDEFGHKHASI